MRTPSQLFAEENAGQRIIYNSYNWIGNSEVNLFGRVIAWLDEISILIEFEAPSTKQNSIESYDGFTFVVDDAKWGWHVSLSDIKLIEENPGTTKFILYNNLCIKCKAPSRKIKGFAFCSSYKCKTNIAHKKRYIQKTITRIKNEPGTLLSPILVKCPFDTASCRVLPFTPSKLSAICNRCGPFKYLFEIGKYYKHSFSMRPMIIEHIGELFIQWSE